MSQKLFQLFTLLTLLVLVSCSASKEQKIIDAIDTALNYLSQSSPDCQKAIDVLEDVSGADKNPRYLQAYASAYACRGGFSELQLFEEIDTIDSSAFLTSLTKLSTSSQSEAEGDDFDDLQRAIDIILYSGSRTTPSAAHTKTIFGNRHGTNLNLQALYMIIVQLGRFNRWYGNTAATGVKGSGSQGNTCFFDYEATPLAIATAHGGGNACVAGNTGSPSLDYAGVTTAVAQRRLCQGAILVNNLLNILENTTLSSNTSLGDISTLYADIAPYVSAAELLDPDMDEFIDTLSQETCETAVAADDDVIQLYFASIFEGGLP
jgi:hypothetical protein